MARFLLFIVCFCGIFGAAAFGEGGRVITRKYSVESPPTIEDIRAGGGKKEIVRIYRRVEQNETKQSDLKFFVGAGIELFNRKRSVEIDSKNNGALIRLGGSRVVTADGSRFEFSESETENAPSAEICVAKGKQIYFGAKFSLQNNFVELGGFVGARVPEAAIAGWTPIAQFSGSIGYENSEGGIEPDNFSIGLGAGFEKFLVKDSFGINALIFYRHRIWQEFERIYGDERWQDGELGAGIGARFYF